MCMKITKILRIHPRKFYEFFPFSTEHSTGLDMLTMTFHVSLGDYLDSSHHSIMAAVLKLGVATLLRVTNFQKRVAKL
jgi:hypothetical protein